MTVSTALPHESAASPRGVPRPSHATNRGLGPVAALRALQQTAGNRAVTSQLAALHPTVQRFPPAPPVEYEYSLWAAYLTRVESALHAYQDSAQPTALDSANFEAARKALETLRRDLATLGKALHQQAQLASLPPGELENLKKRKSAADKVVKSVIQYGEAKRTAIDRREAARIPLPPAQANLTPELTCFVGQTTVALSAAFDLGRTPGLAIRQGLLRTAGRNSRFVPRIAHVVDAVIAVQHWFDKPSLKDHILKLTVDYEGYTGIIAELEAALSIIRSGQLGRGEKLTMGARFERPAPYGSAMTTQEMDLSYVDTAGKLNLIEVKDLVSTLETKMNKVSGAARGDSPRDEQHFAPKQLASLVAVRDKEDREREHGARLSIICGRASGWVRFIVGHNCTNLINANVTLVIQGREFRPSQLRALRDDVLRQLDHRAPEWRLRQREPRPAGPYNPHSDTRHAAIWAYEHDHPIPSI